MAAFFEIRKASRAEIPIWSLADLGIEVGDPAVSWPEITNPPKQEVVTEMISADSPVEVAEKLAEKIMEEKVL